MLQMKMYAAIQKAARWAVIRLTPAAYSVCFVGIAVGAIQAESASSFAYRFAGGAGLLFLASAVAVYFFTFSNTVSSWIKFLVLTAFVVIAIYCLAVIAGVVAGGDGLARTPIIFFGAMLTLGAYFVLCTAAAHALDCAGSKIGLIGLLICFFYLIIAIWWLHPWAKGRILSMELGNGDIKQ
jgi:hypothetical protein